MLIGSTFPKTLRIKSLGNFQVCLGPNGCLRCITRARVSNVKTGTTNAVIVTSLGNALGQIWCTLLHRSIWTVAVVRVVKRQSLVVIWIHDVSWYKTLLLPDCPCTLWPICNMFMFKNLLINHDQLTTPNYNKLFVVLIIGKLKLSHRSTL